MCAATRSPLTRKQTPRPHTAQGGADTGHKALCPVSLCPVSVTDSLHDAHPDTWLTPPADKKCRKGAIFDAGVSSAPGEVITAATAVTRPVGHPKKSLTPEFQRI